MILVVDLDGTLVKTDMFYESFWSAAKERWYNVLIATKKILDGKAALKSYLSAASNIDVSLLPYDDAVIRYIKEYREKGGRVALVTATNVLADKIADHLKFLMKCMALKTTKT